MINFFPVLYHDELLYSAVSRYKRMSGIISRKALESDLFNRSVGKLSVLFPQDINHFISNFPPYSKVTTKDIIMNHTMYPFYTAFLDHDKSTDIYGKMANKNARNIENIVGLAGNKVKPNSYLRYCPLCFKKDIEEIGESYWRRLHQTPGVFYCSQHQVLLKDSSVVINDSRVSDYVSADHDVCNDQITIDILPKGFKELNLEYIKNCTFLFNNAERKDLTFIINFYIDRLREEALASRGGTLYIERLTEAFLQLYPQEYLKLMNSFVDTNQKTNWLRLFVRHNKKNRSPLRHLLFLQFLDVGVNALFNCTAVTGKISTNTKRTPLYSLAERRKEWLNLIQEHPGANRSELKTIGKGLHTWIYTHDWEWYDQVTPKVQTRKKRLDPIDWKKRDQEGLKLAKKAFETLMNIEGKPVRITRRSIRRMMGANKWINHKNLVKTHEYINEIVEDIDSYRKRKIKWAIEEMVRLGRPLTIYKVQLFSGFSGDNREIKLLVEKILYEN